MRGNNFRRVGFLIRTFNFKTAVEFLAVYIILVKQ
jgi:hypothetical protein